MITAWSRGKTDVIKQVSLVKGKPHQKQNFKIIGVKKAFYSLEWICTENSNINSPNFVSDMKRFVEMQTVNSASGVILNVCDHWHRHNFIPDLLWGSFAVKQGGGKAKSTTVPQSTTLNVLLSQSKLLRPLWTMGHKTKSSPVSCS